MSARDELAELIDDSMGEWCDIEGPSHGPALHAADAILAAGYIKPRNIKTVEELDALPEGSKLYSPSTTHSWELRDLSQHGGVKVIGTGGGYTFIRDFIKHEAPLVVLHEATP